ncbi:MAG: hypothetical protein AABY51_09565 [Deltaproteobacteria bacterium]
MSGARGEALKKRILAMLCKSIQAASGGVTFEEIGGAVSVANAVKVFVAGGGLSDLGSGIAMLNQTGSVDGGTFFDMYIATADVDGGGF